jgi:glycosyltransferase-like protein
MTRAANRLRIAMLAHSTNPRGGVVHALHLSEALTELGYDVVLHAPDARGEGFFRPVECETAAFPVAPAVENMTGMVEQRISDYVAYFEAIDCGRFDLFHSHDGISANALTTLKERGRIPGFARTVHHLDQFSDPRLMSLQTRSVAAADVHFVVSQFWRRELLERNGLQAAIVGNGVDMQRYGQTPTGREQDLRQSLALSHGPVFLCVGGVEERKNTVRILDAFLQVLAIHPESQLVIAGGLSLLDHGQYQREFRDRLRDAGSLADRVTVTGPVADDQMAAFYHMADVLVFASLKEGFGLVVLEAMACGLPVVVSSIPPFTEYLGKEDAFWCCPENPASIADAMALAIQPKTAATRRSNGFAVAARHPWSAVAEAHIPQYQSLAEKTYA